MRQRIVSANRQLGARYNAGARALHWAIALAIGGMYLTDQARDLYERDSPQRDWWLGIHASLGITILSLTLIRIVWRVISGAPQALPNSRFVHLAARLGHLALYGFTLCLPLSGFLRYASSGRELTLFGSTIASPFGQNNAINNLGRLFHNGLWTNLLLAMIALHVGAALYHQFIQKDGTLRRML